MKTISVFLSVMLLIFSAVGISHASQIFFDDFNTGADSAWGNERGTWRDIGGVYDATNPDNIPQTYSSVTTLATLTDFAVDVDVNAVDDGGIWLRSNYNSGLINGVLFITGGENGTYDGLYWAVIQNGGTTSFGSVIIDGFQGSDVHLRIEVIGNTYSAFVDNSPNALITMTSNVFSSGSVGLYDYSPISGATTPRGQTFDNFTVSDFSTPAPVPVPSTMLLLVPGLVGLAGFRRKKSKK